MLKWSRLIGRHVSTGHGMWRPLSLVTRHYQWRGDKSRVAKDQEGTGSEEEARVLCPLKDVARKDSRWARRKLTREPEMRDGQACWQVPRKNKPRGLSMGTHRDKGQNEIRGVGRRRWGEKHWEAHSV